MVCLCLHRAKFTGRMTASRRVRGSLPPREKMVCATSISSVGFYIADPYVQW